MAEPDRSTEGPPRDSGPPRRSACEIIEAIEPSLDPPTSTPSTIGSAAPHMEGSRRSLNASLNPVQQPGAEVSVIDRGAAFKFSSIDLCSSVTPIPFEISGFRNGTLVFRFGTQGKHTS